MHTPLQSRTAESIASPHPGIKLSRWERGGTAKHHLFSQEKKKPWKSHLQLDQPLPGRRHTRSSPPLSLFGRIYLSHLIFPVVLSRFIFTLNQAFSTN